MTANQTVAHNLRRARLDQGWTQTEAAAHIGLGWSKAVYSAAERSVCGRRIRQFDADEIAVIAQAFGLPVAYFFEDPQPFAVRGDLLADRLREDVRRYESDLRDLAETDAP